MSVLLLGGGGIGQTLVCECETGAVCIVVWYVQYDRVRINQIYEQAKWSLISERIHCTDEQMMMFAAIQVYYSL